MLGFSRLWGWRTVIFQLSAIFEANAVQGAFGEESPTSESCLDPAKGSNGQYTYEYRYNMHTTIEPIYKPRMNIHISHISINRSTNTNTNNIRIHTHRSSIYICIF